MLQAKKLKYGGIRSLDKIIYKTAKIENAFLPLNAVVLLKNNAMQPESLPIVRVGQGVREGQLIAKADNYICCNVHSPIPGIVKRIDKLRSIFGYESTAVMISLDGTFSISGKKPERYLWKSLNKADLLHIIHDKGLVSIPTGISLASILSKKSTNSVLIVNVLEMDPYCRVEEELIRTRCDDVIDAAAMISRISNPSQIIIAIDETQFELFGTLIEQAIKSVELNAQIQVFNRSYPQGAPNQLAASLGLSLSNVLVIEPSTLITVHDAIVSNKAHIIQYVFIGGGAIKYPSVLKARIGSTIGDLLEECGGFSGHPDNIIVNNPYTGVHVANFDSSITKTTRAILALSKDETKTSKERPCTRCAACIEVCPEKLSPYLLIKLIQAGKIDEAVKQGLNKCILCGACAYVCRSRIQLLKEFAACKSFGV